MADPEAEEGVLLPILWEGLDEAEIKFVNQMLVQLGSPGHEGEFIVTLGQLHPPGLMGDRDANREKLKTLPYVPVKVVSKLGIPVARVRELRDILTEMLDRYEAATAAG